MEGLGRGVRAMGCTWGRENEKDDLRRASLLNRSRGGGEEGGLLKGGEGGPENATCTRSRSGEEQPEGGKAARGSACAELGAGTWGAGWRKGVCERELPGGLLVAVAGGRGDGGGRG